MVFVRGWLREWLREGLACLVDARLLTGSRGLDRGIGIPRVWNLLHV